MPPSADLQESSEDTDLSSSDDDELLHFPAFDDELDIESHQSSASGDSSNMSEEQPHRIEVDEAEEEIMFTIPNTLQQLRMNLLENYSPTQLPPSLPFHIQTLSVSEKHSLMHYIAWARSNGTVLAYAMHAKVLQNVSGVEILSLHSVRKLVKRLTQLNVKQVEICPESCIAYTGEFSELRYCPYIRDGKICNQPRFKKPKTPSARDKPAAQMMCLPIMETIRAMFANKETASLLRHRDKCLQQALHIVATARRYSDFGDSQVHIHHYKDMGLFRDSRDIALSISTDGAQLTMKKKSDTWIVLISLLNLPAEMRIKSGNTIIAFATPGPNPPGLIESFLYPLFVEMAKASEGIWTWDAVESSYFLNRACICMALGDMLGSAKLNGMAGHTATYGDRFSMVKAARSSKKKGSRALYYPMSPPDNDNYNPGRPIYQLDKLPMRNENHYWETIEKLGKTEQKRARAIITKETGISRMPLCAASPAFCHPNFFPIDPFHLIYENCMAFLWDLWTSLSPTSDPIHLHADLACEFGKAVTNAIQTLPPAFCGPVRDPFLKRQSQYKIYEWMALLHWYILPIGIELGFQPAVLQNFSKFFQIIEYSMKIRNWSHPELTMLHVRIRDFLTEFETLYIGNNPENISRARLCIFQLIHIPQHIMWNGSIRLGSQATVERAIGEMGHKIRSKKSPFANLANIIYERELVKLLLLYYPHLNLHTPSKPKEPGPFQKIRILKKEQQFGQEYHTQLQMICNLLDEDSDSDSEDDGWHRWGKMCLHNGYVLSSKLSERNRKPSDRSSRYFEVLHI